MAKRSGICVAGNMIVDITYPVDVMPRSGELVPITGDPIRTTGGAVNNVIVGLAKMDPQLPLQAVGRIGRDSEGELTKNYLGQFQNIDLSCVKEDGITSFTLVMSENITRQRTFFTFGGAGDKFCEADIDWDKITANIFHIGYILLLKTLDESDPEYGTKMARLLKSAKDHGLKTSIDVVTEAGDRFKKLVTPAMKYADYCVINEMEAQYTTGVNLRDDDGTLHPENMEKALKKMKELGVSTWAVIHCPEGGWGLDKSNKFVY
ncbi:MAG: carbohydrate kinase family protein, partial [Oscillospiraceae bacterium]|nr:carbohydrate kinase family protein [Oscillospiraceae bacterium]